MGRAILINDIVVFKHQPELGVWRVRNFTINDMWVGLKPWKDVPPGLMTLAEYATINVSRTHLHHYTITGEQIDGLSGIRTSQARQDRR